MVADTFRNLVASEAIARYFAGVLRPFLRPIKCHKVRNLGGMVFEADDCPEAMLRKLFILLDSVEVGAVHLPACNQRARLMEGTSLNIEPSFAPIISAHA